MRSKPSASSGAVGADPDSLDRQSIGARLRLTRLELGYRQGAFAARAGLRANAYCQVENGTNRISLPAACRLCDTYGLTLDWIYRGRPDGLPAALAMPMRALSGRSGDTERPG